MPPTFGSGPLPDSTSNANRGSGFQDKVADAAAELVSSNLQEARVERDAWRGIAETLSRMEASRKLSAKTEHGGAEDVAPFMDYD